MSRRIMRPALFVVWLLSLAPGWAIGDWWNPDWAYRKALTVDVGGVEAGAEAKPLENVPVLIRLHTGNFGYFLDVSPKGEDIRFIADDGQTPLKFHIDKIDPINEMALIWVQVPSVAPGRPAQFHMYYGNQSAVPAQDAAGTFDTNQTLVYHFDASVPRPVDATAYANAAVAFTATQTGTGLVGDAAHFDGTQTLVLPATPTLALDPAAGWTLTAWVKIDQAQSDAWLYRRVGGDAELTVGIDGTAPYVRVSAAGTVVETPRDVALSEGAWHQIAVTGSAEGLRLYVDGRPATQAAAVLPPLDASATLGAAEDGAHGLIGELDELRLANVARDADWIAFTARTLAADAPVVYGDDGSAGSESGGGESYFMVTLRNVTVDGWVVIGVLAVMAAISWVVMVSKGMVINRIRNDNRGFLDAFQRLGVADIDDLDSDAVDEGNGGDSPLLTALVGDHAHFASSTLYRIYHAGVQEMHRRVPRAVGAAAAPLRLSAQAVNAIRATMDGSLVRELQKLNGQMVLLTIAISGGPFLGLLGTVVGVMITFAAIAATGDVNVNSIAPGIAAALVATVAGLAVAIPALFGYNYLGSRIKEISADMQVFVDEFVAKIAEQHS